MLALLEPGDEVIYPNPGFPIYESMINFLGAKAVAMPLEESRGFSFDLNRFESLLSPRTKMVILNSPGNPTGSVYTREELEGIVEVAAEEDIYILSDEIYEKLVYDDAKHVSIASLSQEAYDLTITVNGFSKAYAMTGWRLGYMAASEAVAKAVDNIQSHSTSHPCSFAQKGAVAALKGDQQPLADMRDEFSMRRNYMYDRITKIPNITAVRPDGAFYVLVNISQLGLSSQNFADRLLSKANVAVVPGIAFGDDRTVRLSYATSIDVIKKGLDRFQDFCRTL
jgi:aspartate aminotransferase